uniref:hypothetical protein n=1 Tax=Streptomyces sp. NRRL WC-3774 TaxID=1463937 RepID=UPI0004C960EC
MDRTSTTDIASATAMASTTGTTSTTDMASTTGTTSAPDAWEELVTSALLGTARRTPPGIEPGPGAPVALLDAAAVEICLLYTS